MQWKRKNKKYHGAWAMYDWANSAYNLVITSTIFPAYYESITSKKVQGIIVNDQVDFLGWSIKNSALFEYALAAAYLLIAFLSPLLSSIADYTGKKKYFMAGFAFLGSIACSLLFFFTKETISVSVILFAIAAVGYCGSLVFYNAYLPEIALPQDRDRLSARGYAYGYMGSVLLQLVCLILVLNDHWFADKTFPARFSFLLVGIWWLAFSLIPIIRLPNREAAVHQRNLWAGGFKELKSVAGQLKKMPVMKAYLTAFFFYSTGVQTVMLAASMFGSKELQLGTDALIITILIIQVVAIGGAYLMAKLSSIFGDLQVIFITVLLWIGICIAAFFTHTENQFYTLAVVVGLVMGGIQSLSRSTFSKLMPPTKDTASFFSFYDVVEKLAIVLGLFTFGFIDQLLGMRQSILALVVFFFLGSLLLLFTIKQRKIQQT